MYIVLIYKRSDKATYTDFNNSVLQLDEEGSRKTATIKVA